MPDYEFRMNRLFVEGPIEAGRPIEADPVQTNYLGNVLRLDAGAMVLVFDGRSGEWRARVERHSKRRIELVPQERLREQTQASDLHYLFAPLKHARLDYMVQKAVEMGAGVLRPVMTQHTQASRVNVERMRANAVEAAEQCGILSVPEAREPEPLGKVLANWDPARRLVFCDERAAGENPVDALRALPPAPLALLIGPEGGFSADERDTLLGRPFVMPLSLGPRILRADTAAVAALAVLQAAAGDWR